MTRRDVVLDALNFRTPRYVPWSWTMTLPCADRFQARYPETDVDAFIDPHITVVAANLGEWEEVRPDCLRDPYGVTWDRTVDKDIGVPCEWPIRNPEDLERYRWPDPDRPEVYAHIPAQLAAASDRYRQSNIGFSLFERAWTMRGMEALLMDMVERPEFVEDFLDRICDHNLRIMNNLLRFDIDGVFFGDDYGMQQGLIMGAAHWRRFIKPRLARMFAAGKAAGKYVGMHSCGCVSELFDDLVEIGLNLFNPFQPEVMDVFAMLRKYRGRLAFLGGMSVQKVLPFGSQDEVRAATRRLIEAGSEGGFIFSPSHDVPRDVPPENLVVMMEELKAQPGYAAFRA